MKRYTEEFKTSIIKMHHQEKRSMRSLAEEYAVSAASIHNWIKNAKSVALDDGTETTSKKFKQLQKENHRLKEELEILKAAAVLLGKH
jgi:transposase